MPKQEIPAQVPDKRIRNFSEVLLGLSKRKAVDNAKLFLHRESSAGSDEGCPLGTNIFAFLKSLSRGDINGAMDIIREEDVLPSVSSRILPDPYPNIKMFNEAGEHISIRALQRYVSDASIGRRYAVKKPEKDRMKVAVVGSGPAGLTAAARLAKLRYAVTVFESAHELGGALRYGYPEFRLPKSGLDADIQYIESLGVEFEADAVIGQSWSIKELFGHGFKAVFLATGAGISRRLNVEGEQAAGIFTGDDFLARINLLNAHEFPKYATPSGVGQKVVVVGGGNTAFDCARVCARFDTQVTLVMQGAEDDASVRPLIVTHAREEGVSIQSMTGVKEILVNDFGCVKGLRCFQMDYADASGTDQWKPVAVPDSDFEIETDMVIVAVGHEPNALIAKATPQLDLNDNGTIRIDEVSGQTSIPGVFAGGAVVGGAGPVTTAVLAAKQAVKKIDEYLMR